MSNPSIPARRCMSCAVATPRYAVVGALLVSDYCAPCLGRLVVSDKLDRAMVELVRIHDGRAVEWGQVAEWYRARVSAQK